MLENPFVQFVLGLILLWYGAHLVVLATENFTKKFNFSPFVASFVLIGFATSSPEIFISIISSFEKNSAIAVGNAIGSNIANVLLVLAICFLFLPQDIRMIDPESQSLFGYSNKRSIQIFFFALIFLTVISFSMLLDHKLYKDESIIIIVVFLIMMGIMIFQFAKTTSSMLIDLPTEEIKTEEQSQSSSNKIFVQLLFGLGVIIVGTEFLLSGAISIAKSIGVTTYIIGLSMTAIGTSLPELATGLESVRKKNYGFVAGNILGSNIFNIGIVLGLAGLIHPATLEGSYLWLNIAMIILSTIIMYMFFTRNRDKIMYSIALGAIFFYIYYQTWLYGVN